jgi:DNA-binding protein HU-beta
MNRRELIRALAAKGKLTVAQATDAVNGIFGIESGIIPAAIRAGEPVVLPGFGRFARRERPARTGRDPRTGAALSIAASTAPAFKPARRLRDAVLDGAPRGKIVVEGETPEEPVFRGPRRATSSTGPRRDGTRGPARKGR